MPPARTGFFSTLRLEAHSLISPREHVSGSQGHCWRLHGATGESENTESECRHARQWCEQVRSITGARGQGQEPSGGLWLGLESLVLRGGSILGLKGQDIHCGQKLPNTLKPRASILEKPSGFSKQENLQLITKTSFPVWFRKGQAAP